MTPAVSPLDPQQLHEVTQARRRRRRLSLAAGVAAFNGWSTAACAALSLLLALMTPWALLASAILAGLAAVELYGRARLQRLDDRGLVLLAGNQAAFCILLCLYALGRIYAAFTSPGELAEVLANDPAMAELGMDVERLVRVVAVVVYGCVILASLAFNGGCALYYLTRRKHLRAYLDDTPAWVRELEQQG